MNRSSLVFIVNRSVWPSVLGRNAGLGDIIDSDTSGTRVGFAFSKHSVGSLNLVFTLMAYILFAATIPAANALESDRNKPITITSNEAERDEIKGTTTYSGEVVMEQGSMRIDADTVVIHNTREKVTKIIALGKPARYQQKPNDSEGLVIAEANTLEYSLETESLHLIESASLKQEGTSLSGNRIDYDVRKSVVKAGSGKSATERVRMVIPPKALNNEKDKEKEKTKNSETTQPSSDAQPNKSPLAVDIPND